MPLIDMQVRLRELGRIRTGITVEGTSKTGKRFRRPEKLATFRLTSPSRTLIEAAAELYKGTIAPWESPAGAQWELVTQVDSLPIVIPSGESLSQWYELWAAGGCERRCDGRTEQLSDGPCLCPADPAERRELASRQVPEACKPTTRLNVVLPDLPDLGVWRLESHGYYAAVELAGAAQFLSLASAAGMNIPARLRLEQREKKVPGRPTNRYAVPVIEFTTTRITDLLAAGAGPMMLGDPTPAPVSAQLAAGPLAPEKGRRARGPKVERPPMGQAPAVPDGAGFGRPVPTAPAAAIEPPPVGGWPVEEPATAPPQASPADIFADADTDSGDAPAAPQRGSQAGAGQTPADVAALVGQIRRAAERSGLVGEITAPQKSELLAAFEGLDGDEIGAGIRVVFARAEGKFAGAAEAQAVITAVRTVGTDAFRAAWREIGSAAAAAVS